MDAINRFDVIERRSAFFCGQRNLTVEALDIGDFGAWRNRNTDDAPAAKGADQRGVALAEAVELACKRIVCAKRQNDEIRVRHFSETRRLGFEGGGGRAGIAPAFVEICLAGFAS